MASRIVVRGFAAAGALALVAVLAVTAVAQPAPVRVVQGSDGTLYLVQAGSLWTLVPDQISDADLAALTLSGEVDGTIPSQSSASAAPQAAAPAPPPAAAPAPAAAAPAVVDKLVRNYNVNEGAQSVVSITGGDGGYTVTAKGPFHWKVVAGAGAPGTCDLPDGTIIATFAFTDSNAFGQYVGNHGIWDKNCQFQAWGPMVLKLNGSVLTGNYGGGGPVSFSPA